MTILDPDGSVDTYYLEPGDVYFVPRAYPHQIEVIGDEPIHFLHLLRPADPRRHRLPRLRLGLLAARCSRRSSACRWPTLPELPFTPIDPLIVGKPNPIDPVA